MTQEPVAISDVTVVLPVAGKATRARKVTKDSIPKHLIKLDNGQAVLDIITGNLQKVGFRKFVFCVGFLKEQLKDHLGEEAWVKAPGVSYQFDEVDPNRLPGVDGTVLHAIDSLGLKGQAMIIPGDLLLPWAALVEMNWQHAKRKADITLGLTSFVTARTTDVGKIVLDETDKLAYCYSRDETPLPAQTGLRNLTSAAATAIDIRRYAALCDTYRRSLNRPPEQLSLRDDILPWAAVDDHGFNVQGFDVQGEILDLGTPANIRYGQRHWQDYA